MLVSSPKIGLFREKERGLEAKVQLSSVDVIRLGLEGLVSGLAKIEV